MSVPRGIANRNPGNVRITQDAWLGEIHPGTDGSFMQFDTMAHGVRCTAKILLGYQTRGLKTVRQIVDRWAPPNENNTGAYVADVAADCGVTPDQTISLGQGMLARLCRAIFVHENGATSAALVSDADLQLGVAMALGVAAAPSGIDATKAAIGA